MTGTKLLAKASIIALFTLILVEGALVMCGCRQPVVYTQPVVQQVQQPQYEIMQDPNTGVQYSVFYDNGIQQMVELSLFNSWMGMGGYGYVIHHYHDNPSYYRRYDSRTYSSYSRLPRNSPSYNPRFRSSTTPSARTNNAPAFRSGPSSVSQGTSRPSPSPQFRSTPSSSSAPRPAPAFRSSNSSSSSSSRSTPSSRSSRH